MRLDFSSSKFSLKMVSSSLSPSSLNTLTSSVLPKSSPGEAEAVCGIFDDDGEPLLLLLAAATFDGVAAAAVPLFVTQPALAVAIVGNMAAVMMDDGKKIVVVNFKFEFLN